MKGEKDASRILFLVGVTSVAIVIGAILRTKLASVTFGPVGLGIVALLQPVVGALSSFSTSAIRDAEAREVAATAPSAERQHAMIESHRCHRYCIPRTRALAQAAGLLRLQSAATIGEGNVV